MMWAGRAIPEKGLDTVIQIATKTKRTTKLFAIKKVKHTDGFPITF